MRELLFADDDAPCVSHSEACSQSAVDRFASACETFRLVISNKKPFCIDTHGCVDVTHEFPVSTKSTTSAPGFFYV